ncbi:cell division protein ZipA [Methylophaga sp. 42_25_T18]|nr:cell division protein ZipA [Methylophaga sp. 42_25_T18]
MLEIIVITIVLFAVFAAVAWYAHSRSQKMAKLLDLDAEDSDFDEDAYDGDSFDALYEQELKQQQDSVQTNDDTVHLSASARQAAPVRQEPPALTPNQDSSELQSESSPEDEMKMEMAQEHDWDMVISFTIMAMDGEQFAGKAVKTTLDNLDLHFGDMQIYHRYTAGSQKLTLFSVANILDPGTLLPDDMATMTTPGLLIFARLPGPTNGLTLFDDLLDTAQKLAATLGGVLSDEKREPISESTLEEMRSRIFSLNLSLQTESHQ